MDAGFVDLVCFPSLVTLDRPGGSIWSNRHFCKGEQSARVAAGRVNAGARPGKALEPQVVLVKYLVGRGVRRAAGERKPSDDRPDNGNHADRYHAGNQ
jgi:hypothetical protein